MCWVGKITNVVVKSLFNFCAHSSQPEKVNLGSTRQPIKKVLMCEFVRVTNKFMGVCVM